MSELELILREIGDKYTRENFFRLINYVRDSVILQGNWKLHEKTFDGAVTNFKMAHNHNFVPTDIIHLSTVGDHNVYFNYDKFTRDNLDITAAGPVKIRFLSGSYKERLDPGVGVNLPFVEVGAGGSAPTPLAQVCQTMDCAASLAVNDWVYQSTTTNNFAVKTSSNTQVEPTIGIVKSKPTSTTAEVLLLGLYTGLALGSRGKFWLGDTGLATFTFPSAGTGKFVRNLGLSFGDGTIYVNPEKVGLELDDG